MAMDFRDKFPEAARVFQAASNALSLDVEQICRGLPDLPDPRLDLTEFTQPCILTAEIAIYESLKAHFGLSAGYFGGHSLGEYTALVAAGAIPFEVAVRLVRARGRLMQEAVQPGLGSMAAVIMENLPLAEVQSMAGDFQVDVANDNSANQVVLSGERVPVERASAVIQETFQAGVLRVVPLTVSAPFHSRHMAGIETQFQALLEAERSKFDAARAVRVTSNFTGTFHTGSADDLMESLTRQISGRVRWRENMAALAAKSGTILEVGPNRPLSGFFKTIGLSVPSIIDLRTAQRALGAK